MIYIGFVVTVPEAIRLLKLDESIVTSFYDTQPIQRFLRDKESPLQFQYIDKGACAFGLPLCNNYAEQYRSLDDCLADMKNKQREFHQEIENLKVDTSVVNLTWIECGERPMKDPQGYLIDI